MIRLTTASRWLFAIILVTGLSVGAVAQPFATQELILDDGSAEAGFGDGGQFIWFNRFTPAPSDYPLEVTHVQVMFGMFLVNVGDPVDLYFFEDTDGDGDPGTGAVQLDMVSETVQFNDLLTFSEYTLASPVRFETAGDVLIGVVNRASFEGNSDFPAATDTNGPSQVRSWLGSWLAGDVPVTPTFPADEQWATLEDFGLNGNWMVRATYEEMVVAIEPGPDGLPGTHNLSAVYPNPFNPQARFTLEVAEQQSVRIAVYDALGREVATLHNATLSAGPEHEFTIDGAGMPSGVYMVRATGELFADAISVTLIK